MSEHGGVQAWSKAGNFAEAKSQPELSAEGEDTLGGNGVESGGVACSKAARESAVPMETERDPGSLVNAPCAIKPPPSEYRRASTFVEALPDFGGDGVDAGVFPQAGGGGSVQRSLDSPMTHGAAGSADDVSVAIPGNHSDNCGRSTIPGSGPACVTSAANANPLQCSAPSATRTFSNVTKENSAPGVFGTNMTKEQFRYCTSVIKNLKRHPSAQEFLKPVDPIAWNIPDYPSIVERPMDLGTVDDKLALGQYADPDAFAEDVRLVFQNCYLYNGRQSAFSQMAAQVELIFESQMKKVPAASPSVRSAPRALRRPNATRAGAVAPPPPAVTPQATPTKPTAAPRPRPSASRKSGSTARKSSGRNSPAFGADRQMRFCAAVLNELCKKQYAEINWDFLRPVDPVALNIPDYPTVIKRPMDLSTIRRKLNAGEYSSPREFENDVNLMFDNCFTFNRAGDPVYVNGERLREAFRRKWKDLPPPPAPKKAAAKPSAKSASKGGASRRKSASVPARKAKGSDVEEESDESKSEAEDNEAPALGNLEQLALMEAHMNMMQKRLEELKNATVGTKLSKKKKSRSESTPPGGKSKTGKSAKSKVLSSSSASKKSKVEAGGGASSRRGSAAKLPTSLEGERDAGATGSPSAKGKRVKKRRASEVDSSGEGAGGRSGHQSRPASTKKDAASSASGENAKPAAKKAKPAAGPPVILFEHKQQLSEMINSLGEDKLETVIEIIHDSMPHLRGATEEVELDIDALDYGSFYRLYNYVVNDVRPSKKGAGAGRGGGTGPGGKGKGGVGGKSGGNGGATAPDRSSGGEVDPASPRSAVADTTSASSASDAAAAGGFAGTGLEKKKYLSEEEQTQQIMVLEEKLRRFADVAAANSPEEEKREADNNAASDSSDESAESGNESSDGSLA